MKNRELMRLNKVLHKGEVKTVDCISPGYVSFVEDVPLDDENKFGDWVDLDEVEFVTLSEEWLLKFGFETIDWKQGGELIETSISKDGVCLNGQYQLNEYPDTKSIKYVHQLQNLYFALTGEELEYNGI